jgi:hypothetical protein
MVTMLVSFIAFSSSQAMAQTAIICAGQPIPPGWAKTNDFNNPFTCGRPIAPNVYNEWVIERIDNKKRGDRVIICNTPTPPAGWSIINNYWDPFSCGHPAAIIDNMAIIECLNCPLPTPTPTPSPGPQYEGWVDETSCNALQGWVWNKLAPNVPLRVEIVVNGTVIQTLNADVFRQDLQNAGKGDGRHSFKLDLPVRLKNSSNNTINVRVIGTNFLVPNGNKTINCANPIDDARFFVRQQYVDFLAREPDQSGWDFWTSNITQCNGDPACIDYRRVQVSKAFFLSIEFQQTGYFVYRFYKSAFARMPTLTEFSTDKNLVSQNVIVNNPGWDLTLESNKSAYANTFASRGAFLAAYGGLLNHEYVDRLLANAQISNQGFRDDLVNGLNTGQYSRATVLRKIVEEQSFIDREFNAAFVMMQYIGYLRRHPSDPPDGPSMPGYFFWLNKLNTQGDPNEMVRAFLLSTEYRNRFGSDQPFPGSSSSPASSGPPVPTPPCADNDGDGFCDEMECNPYDATVYPGAPIYCNYGEDRNCNGIDDYEECYGWWW